MLTALLIVSIITNAIAGYCCGCSLVLALFSRMSQYGKIFFIYLVLAIVFIIPGVYIFATWMKSDQNMLNNLLTIISSLTFVFMTWISAKFNVNV